MSDSEERTTSFVSDSDWEAVVGGHAGGGGGARRSCGRCEAAVGVSPPHRAVVYCGVVAAWSRLGFMICLDGSE
jgi:hypothetical protein